MKTIDERITDAEARFEQALPEEQVKIRGEIDTLKDLKAEGVYLQGDLNKVDQQNSQKYNELKSDIEKSMGAPWEDVKATLADIESRIIRDPSGAPPAPGSQEGDSGNSGETSQEGDAEPLLARVVDRITSLENNTTQFQRELRSRDVVSNLNQELKNLGLQDQYLGTTHRLIQEDIQTLVDKQMKGEPITAEELQTKAESVKQLSPVWFQAPPSPYPGVPATPTGGEPKELTDAEREARSESII